MLSTLLTKQFGSDKIIETSIDFFQSIAISNSLQSLIESQQIIGSATGYYLFQNNNDKICLVLSEDQKLANKMSTSINHDVFTGDLFPIDYNSVNILSIIEQDKEDTTCIHTENGNFFYFVAKNQDAHDALTFIERHKRKSYSMQNFWKEKKQLMTPKLV